MATHGWGTDRSLADTLFAEGHRFNFYQAVRLLEIMAPERSLVGEGVEADAEAVRFRSEVRFDFPAGDVADVHPPEQKDAPPTMIVNVMGLAGAMGPLPAAYTELLLERVWKKDTALRAFLDIFNHRLVALLYRVRKTYRLGFDFASPQRGHMARYLYSLMGLGTGNLQSRMGVSDRSMLQYTALLAHQPRSMSRTDLSVGRSLQGAGARGPVLRPVAHHRRRPDHPPRGRRPEPAAGDRCGPRRPGLGSAGKV